MLKDSPRRKRNVREGAGKKRKGVVEVLAKVHMGEVGWEFSINFLMELQPKSKMPKRTQLFKKGNRLVKVRGEGEVGEGGRKRESGKSRGEGGEGTYVWQGKLEC